jgi:hypothetical protein
LSFLFLLLSFSFFYTLLQEIFFTIKGILDTVKKSHPGFSALARALGDVFLVPVAENVASVDNRLAAVQLSATELDSERYVLEITLPASLSPDDGHVKMMLRRIDVVVEVLRPVVDTLNEDTVLLHEALLMIHSK